MVNFDNIQVEMQSGLDSSYANIYDKVCVVENDYLFGIELLHELYHIIDPIQLKWNSDPDIFESYLSSPIEYYKFERRANAFSLKIARRFLPRKLHPFILKLSKLATLTYKMTLITNVSDDEYNDCYDEYLHTRKIVNDLLSDLNFKGK
jgi:hypothetical protein